MTQTVEAAGEVEAAYYRRQADQGNAGETKNTLEFVCPNKHEVSEKCICLNVYLYKCACTNVFSCSVMDL